MQLRRRVEVRVVIVADALERTLAPAGAYVFETMSGPRRVDLAAATARAGLRDRLSRGWRGLADACDGAAVPWTMLATGDEPDVVLAPLLRRRIGRGHR
jgi:hypothetical protein